MNSTIDYYNNNAEEYYEQTVNVCFQELYYRFLKYIPKGGRIMDAGCGSGRDAAAFCRLGYRAEGIDASEKLADLARKNHGISVSVCSIEDWTAAEPFDGIWCCAVLLHLTDRQITRFFANLRYNLRPGGALFISVKTGIETGYDDKGRYMRNFTEADIRNFIEKANISGNGPEIKKIWYTEDSTGRDVRWMNIIARMDGVNV